MYDELSALRCDMHDDDAAAAAADAAAYLLPNFHVIGTSCNINIFTQIEEHYRSGYQHMHVPTTPTGTVDHSFTLTLISYMYLTFLPTLFSPSRIKMQSFSWS